MSAHIPDFSPPRQMLEHALEFCDVMDPLSRELARFYLGKERAELAHCLQLVPDDPDFTAYLVLTEMALDLLWGDNE